jgi:ribosome biogenesis GTPase
MNLSTLKRAGLCPYFYEQAQNTDSVLARITHEYRDSYLALTDMGETRCRIVGTKLNEFKTTGNFPAVGDWVEVTQNPMASFSSIDRLMHRKNLIERGGITSGVRAQTIAANVDFGLVIVPLSTKINVARLERFISILVKSQVTPVVVLSKSDQSISDVGQEVENLMAHLGFDHVYPISSTDKLGLEALFQFFENGKTSILLGASGVGKSTLINAILETKENKTKEQKTQEVRAADDKGKHTTVSRSLHLTPQNGILIDTPGIRALSLTISEEDVDESFQDVARLIGLCRFNNCSHQQESSCAVTSALESGELAHSRWRSYQKLQGEARHFRAKEDRLFRSQELGRWKKISKAARAKRNYKDY